MIWCEWDSPEGDPGQSCVHLFAGILSTSFTSVSIFLSAVTLVYLSQWYIYKDANSYRVVYLSNFAIVFSRLLRFNACVL